MNILNELEKIYPSLPRQERKVALQRSEEHTSELQSQR